MTPEEAIASVKKGKLLPVYLVSGEESHLADAAIRAIRDEVTRTGIAGLNDDTFHAGTTAVEEVLSIARTMPMMAQRRFVLVRDVDKWDSTKKEKGDKASALDQLSEYAEGAADSTVLVLVGPKLDKRRRLYTSAKKNDFLVSCETPKRHELPEWIVDRVRARGNTISRGTADLLAELQGPELAPIADAVERLCLYVGEGKPIGEDDVSACVVRLRTASVWELVSAVGKRDLGNSLRVLDDVFDPTDRGMPLIGILAWATRQLIKFDGAKKRGLSSADAAKAAGVPPFKSRDLEDQLRGLSPEVLTEWLAQLAQADLALKGGSRRPARATLEQMLIDLCRVA